MKHSSDPSEAYQADLLAREHAHYVKLARSWLPCFHKDPNCHLIPDEAVLAHFLRNLKWIHATDGVDLTCFWEKLLEEHGFESRAESSVRTWLEILEESMDGYSEREIAALAKMEITSENRPYPRQLSFWGPERKRSDRPELTASQLLFTRKQLAEIEAKRREKSIAFQVWQVREKLASLEKLRCGERIIPNSVTSADQRWRSKFREEAGVRLKNYYRRLDSKVPPLSSADQSGVRSASPERVKAALQRARAVLAKQRERQRAHEERADAEKRAKVPEARKTIYLTPKDVPKETQDFCARVGKIIQKDLEEMGVRNPEPEPQEKVGSGRDWNWDVWDGTPDPDRPLKGMTEAEYRAKHPILYPPEKERAESNNLATNEKQEYSDYHNPQEWDGTPELTVRSPEEHREYEKQHPILFLPKKDPLTGGEIMQRLALLVSLPVFLILFAWLVWPTPYWYCSFPNTPGNVIRISRFSGRIWGIRNGRWYNGYERDEIAKKEAEEIRRLCWNAPYPDDPKGIRQIDFKGYSFSCP